MGAAVISLCGSLNNCIVGIVGFLFRKRRWEVHCFCLQINITSANVHEEAESFEKVKDVVGTFDKVFSGGEWKKGVINIKELNEFDGKCLYFERLGL